jgi:hypothetical protein
MRSMFSQDGNQWVFGDVFGVTRVDLGKTLKVSKHTIKFANPVGAISMTADGKLGMCDGHEQGGAYGSPMLMGFGLPALGVKHKLPHEIAGVMTTPAGVRVAKPALDVLELHELDGDNLKLERVLSLNAAPSIGALQIGPQRDPATMTEIRPPCTRLRPMPDGRYVVLSSGRQLVAGKVGDASYTDEDWWRAELVTDPLCEVSMEVVGEDVWVAVMDVAQDVAHIAHITRTGVITRYERPSITPPAFTDQHIVTQPTSDEICVRTIATGEEQTFDVSAHNPHSYPTAEASVYKGSPAPPAPTRLPGYLAASGARVFFVPWHGETIVELGSGVVLSRGLEAAPGMFRRLVLESFARHNQALRPLQLRVELSVCEDRAKHNSSTLSYRLPGAPNTLKYAVAGSFVSGLTERYELRAGGWSWSGFGSRAGPSWVTTQASVQEVEQTINWMIQADTIPFEATHTLASIYSDQMGIPSESYYQKHLLLSGVPERMLLRAMLESLKACGWPVTSAPASWATEPITAAMADEAIQRLHTWERYVPNNGVQLLSFMLAHHMGADAAPVLIKLIKNFPQPLNWKFYHSVGECLVWLCHRDPQLKAGTIAAIQAVNHPEASVVGTWTHEKALILAALKRGAKHLWSNG